MDRRADAGGHRSRRTDLKFRERLPRTLLRFRIVFFSVGHSEAFVNQFPRFIFPAHLRVNSPELDIMHETVRVERDGFLHGLFGLLERSLRQVAINYSGQKSLCSADFCQDAVPSAKN